MEIFNGKINSTNSYTDFKLEEMDRKPVWKCPRNEIKCIENRMYTIRKNKEDFMLKEEDLIQISIF